MHDISGPIPVTRPAFSTRAAILVALMLLVGSGTAFRALASYYARSATSVPIPPGTLARFPIHLGDWEGQEVPMDQRVVQATDADQILNRRYHRAGGRESVALFVAYGVRLRDLAPHRPEVCYPGAGWTLRDHQTLDLKAADGSTLPCRLMQFEKGGLQVQRIRVLNYYIVDGQCWSDVSLLRSKAWRANAEGSYSAQVQITCPDDTDHETSDEPVRRFAAQTGPIIRQLLVDAVAGTQVK